MSTILIIVLLILLLGGGGYYSPSRYGGEPPWRHSWPVLAYCRRGLACRRLADGLIGHGWWDILDETGIRARRVGA